VVDYYIEFSQDMTVYLKLPYCTR